MRQLLIVLAVLALLPSAAAAAGIGTNEVAGADNVYVRPKPQSWTIGTLFRVGPNVAGVEHMDVQEVSSAGWAYGYVYGSFQGCGWVDASYLSKINSTVSHHCATDDATRMPGPESMFSAWTPAENPNGAQYHTVACDQLSAYGNYRGGSFVNKYGDLPANHDVDWRYTTKDGAAAMVKDTANGVGAPPWFFVRRACIAEGAAATAQPPAPPVASTPGPTPVPSNPTAAPTKTKPKVCRRGSRSRHCKSLRRTCRRHHSHSRRCRRAFRP